MGKLGENLTRLVRVAVGSVVDMSEAPRGTRVFNGIRGTFNLAIGCAKTCSAAVTDIGSNTRRFLGVVHSVRHVWLTVVGKTARQLIGLAYGILAARMCAGESCAT